MALDTEPTPLIVAVIQRHHPSWLPPPDTGREWHKAMCPYHNESNPSASISFKLNAFKCFSCSVVGDAIKLIMEQEEVNYSTAVGVLQDISGGSYEPVPVESAKQPCRRVFGQERTEFGADTKPVRTGIRRRTFNRP
jgi:hypothetical protein